MLTLWLSPQVSLSLTSHLLRHCGLPGRQVLLYLVNLLLQLVSMLCAGFSQTAG